MRASEVATLAGCTKMTVLRAARANKIPGARRRTDGDGWTMIEIPDAAGRAWAASYIPHAAKRKACPICKTERERYESWRPGFKPCPNCGET